MVGLVSDMICLSVDVTPLKLLTLLILLYNIIGPTVFGVQLSVDKLGHQMVGKFV